MAGGGLLAVSCREALHGWIFVMLLLSCTDSDIAQVFAFQNMFCSYGFSAVKANAEAGQDSLKLEEI